MRALNEHYTRINCSPAGNLDSIVAEIKKVVAEIDTELLTSLLIQERNKYPILRGLMTTNEYLSCQN